MESAAPVGVEVCAAVPEEQWHRRYPDVDREYVWIYPLVRSRDFDAACLFSAPAVPRPSLDTAVYLHVPACLFHCPMCAFYKEVVRAPGDLEWYADAVVRELELHVMAPATRGANLRTIYFGGGTATLLSPAAIARIIKRIRALLPAEREPEVTLEGHPITVDQDYLDAVREAGVNRISFGVQSFNADVLALLRTRQTPEANRRAIDWSHRAGFRTVAIDLLYRIPGQSAAAAVEQLRVAYDCGVTAISTYSLQPSAQQESISAAQPSEKEDEEIFYAIHDEMEARGWVHVAQPDYAAPGHENDELLVSWAAPQGLNLSLGPGAWSVFGGAVYCNVHDLAEYRRVIERDCLPVLAGTRMTLDDARSRYPVLGARCFTIPGQPFRAAFGERLTESFGEEIALLERQGLVGVRGEDVVVTRKGKYYVDNISKTFYSGPNRGRSQPWGLYYRGGVSPTYFNPRLGVQMSRVELVS